MSELKLPAASGGGSISIKGPSSSGSDVDLLDTSGNLKPSGQMYLNDDKKLIVGTGGDMEIYHLSDQNYIYSGNGRINLRASEVRCEKADGSEVLAKFIADGACELRHNDSAKLTTTADGITVSGDIFVGTNGKGISFESSNNNGVGGDSTRFDDYEEGTFNPSWGGVTNTNNYNDWVYRKVGNLVYVTGRFKCATTTNNGTTVHGTVPFTPAGNPTNGYNTSVGTVMHKEMNTYSSGNFTSYLSTNTNLYFYKCQQNGDWDSLGSDDVAVNDEMIVSLTYITG
jgi:hypothetical protein